MDITFSCTNCGQSLAVDEAGTGITVDCPSCGKPVYVPSSRIAEPTTSVKENTNAESIEHQRLVAHLLNERRKGEAKRKKRNVAFIWFFASFAIFLCGLIAGNGLALIIGFISGLGASSYILPEILRVSQEEQRKLQAEVDALIQKHADTLLIKKLQKSRQDGYGNIDDDEWIREMEYFCQRVLRPAFPQLCNWPLLDRFPRRPKEPISVQRPGLLDRVFLSERELRRIRKDADTAETALVAENIRRSLFNRINTQLDAHSKNKSIQMFDVSSLTPTGYEAYCVQILRDSGWDATTTQTSGDQGVDILAKRLGKKAVFQCKFYTSLVGNAAVQEAIAGKAWASAYYAFVVSNADFTPPAKALAAKTGVHLIHNSALSNLEAYLNPLERG